MPVRTIPKNYRNLTGLVSNTRTHLLTAFESTLERDFLLLLDFDLDVEYYEEQPITIEYLDSDGRRHTYTPDVFVQYRTDSQITKPLLCEVKYRDELRENWSMYRPRFRAAQRHAHQQGWRFRLVTERVVRTPYLANVRFLRQYRTTAVETDQRQLILETLRRLRQSDPAGLLTALTQDRWQQAKLLAMVWQLVASRQIGVDLNRALTMRSRLWSLSPP